MRKWSNHCELQKVRVHKEVVNYLGEIDISTDKIVDTFIYSEATTSNTKGVTIELTDTNKVNLSEHSTTLSSLPTESTEPVSLTGTASSINI